MGSIINNIANEVTGFSNLTSAAGNKTVANLMGMNAQFLKDALENVNTQPSLCFIPIYAESFEMDKTVDVSNTMLLSQNPESLTESVMVQKKTYVTDNAAPRPRTWNIQGYIKALLPLIETSLIVKPTLMVQQAVLEAAADSRDTVKLKTDTGEVVDVLITKLTIGSTPKGTNARTVKVTVQEVKVLESAVNTGVGYDLDSTGAASIPKTAFANLGRATMLGFGMVSTIDTILNTTIY